MYCIQITDLHLGTPNEDTRGVDVRKNFQNILSRIQKHQPDYLIISGDLCYMEGEKATYEWIRELLEATSIPYFPLSGNHDQAELLAATFGLESEVHSGELFYQRTLGTQEVLFLDTTSGLVSYQQLNWLQEALGHSTKARLIFMHHPPLQAGVPYMDNKHGLRNHRQVADILQAHAAPIHVFTGHFHVERSVSLGSLHVHITPSCFFQIDPRFETFAVDHYRIGFREIFWDGNILKHGVRYFDGA